MVCFSLSLVFLALFVVDGQKTVEFKRKSTHVIPDEGYDFTGCPEDNDFWTRGVISSPYYPNPYPNNIKCWYYMNAELGHVVRFNFTNFDLESCCDYVTIYDGPTDISPIMVQFGGPNATATKPTGVLTSTTRFALMTFITDKVVAQSGFSVSYDSVSTSSPCNRDILLVINGLSSLGTQDNFLKQLDFIANHLVTKWTMGEKKTRVFINLQTDADFAIVYTAEDLITLDLLKQTVLGLTYYVPDVTANNGSDFESLFRYGADDEDGDSTFVHRYGIEQVQLIFVAQDPNNSQDFYEAEDFAHQMRDKYDTKVITIAMGPNINVTKVGTLSYGNGFYFGADYDNLPSLADPVNAAICQMFATGCGV